MLINSTCFRPSSHPTVGHILLNHYPCLTAGTRPSPTNPFAIIQYVLYGHLNPTTCVQYAVSCAATAVLRASN